jgi:hypothetical protein
LILILALNTWLLLAVVGVVDAMPVAVVQVAYLLVAQL